LRTEPALRAGVVAAAGADQIVAESLARELSLPLLQTGTNPRQCDQVGLVLIVSGSSRSLQLTGKGAPGPVTVEFGAGPMRHRRRSGHNEMLGRAVGVGKKQNLTVLDATAGLGRDSFVLADLGCRVYLCERNPLVQELLCQGLGAARSGEDPWLRSVASAMELVPGDAMMLPALPTGCDVVYLDPMFPQRDKSAAVKKEMALFHYLLQDEPGDEAELMHWALAQEVARIVVKRPSRAAPLGDQPSSHSIQGKAVRYDVYVKRALS